MLDSDPLCDGSVKKRKPEYLDQQVQCLGYEADKQDSVSVRDPLFATFLLLHCLIRSALFFDSGNGSRN
jgi:hypothetical protein